MPKTYTEADKPVLSLLASVLNKHHKTVVNVGVTFKVLMVSAPRCKKTGEPMGPALKLHGYPCKAIIKINPVEKRAAGMADCLMLLDGDHWHEMSEAEQAAVLSHEVTHIVPIGETDDNGRPKVKMRHHDWELGGFSSVVEDYGDAATEKQQCVALQKEYKQLLFPWG